jgi:predicted AAA+ superfamily ATPase
MEWSRIVEYNPWWDTGEVRKELCPPYERQMLTEIKSSLEVRNVTVLRGARRTGKSTLLYQAIRNLLSKDVDPDSILYFSFDDEKGTVQDLLDEFGSSVLGSPLESRDRVYIFLDEVQKCKKWAEQVKRNYDLYPKIKFVLSGSVSFEIGARTMESLAGRAMELVLFPMSFGEYLGIRGIEAPKVGAPLKRFLMAERRLRPYFGHFLMTGGFPELAPQEDRRRIRDYVLSSIVRRAVYGDLFQIGGKGDPESMMALLRAVSETPGMLLNYERLGSDIGRDRRTVSSYLSRLEYAMIIRTLGNIRGSSLSSSRKHRKAYPVSSALTFAFRGFDLDERDMGRVYETAVLNKIDAQYFWRHRENEIDFITGRNGENAIEVKLRERGKLHFEQYAKFCELKKAYVITKNVHGMGQNKSVQYKKIPAWALCAGARIRLNPI